MNEFRHLKRRRFQMDGYRCVLCGNGSSAELRIHHRLPRSEGGEDSLDNLQTLCTGCHAALHRETRRVRARRRTRSREIRRMMRVHIRGMREELTARVLELLSYFFVWLEECIRTSNER